MKRQLNLLYRKLNILLFRYNCRGNWGDCGQSPQGVTAEKMRANEHFRSARGAQAPMDKIAHERKRVPILYSIYQKLFASFGPQHWWPAKTPFEVMVGAILTQNTSWSNVKKAIRNLKENKLLAPTKLYQLELKKLTSQIKSSGFYNIKAKRLKEFLKFFFRKYQGKIEKMTSVSLRQLRQELLSINGVGPETADSILLYALNKPIFVVDAYTKRILLRHHLIRNDATYQEVQDLFMRNLKPDTRLFNEYHALLVKLGKEFCLKNKPKCKDCPINFKN